MISVIKIGTTDSGIVSLSLLPVPVADPTKYKFHEGTKLRGASSGQKLWAGLPWAELYWSVIEQVQRDQLRSFCTGASANIFVQLPVNDNYSELMIFSGQMTWMEDEDPAEYNKVYGLALKFESLLHLVAM